MQGPGTINVVDTAGLAGPINNWGTNSPTSPLYSQIPQCGTGVGSDPGPCNILGVARNLRSPYVSTWTLGIQRAITNNMSLEVAYVGNHGTKLLGLTNLNQPPVGTGWTAAASLAGLRCRSYATGADPIQTLSGSTRRVHWRTPQLCPGEVPTTNGVGLGVGNKPCFPYLGYVEFFSNHDKSNYNGLQVTLTQRTSHGLSFTAGYTYAHALDDNGDNEGNGLHTPIDSANPGSLYGNSDFDIRHRFTFSVDYAIPGRKGFGQAARGLGAQLHRND